MVGRAGPLDPAPVGRVAGHTIPPFQITCWDRNIQAQNPAVYHLTLPGKKGSYTARNAKAIKVKSAAYNAATDSVTLIPARPFALTKPVQLVVSGTAPSGLQDSFGRLVDGGKNATALLGREGATITDARRDAAEGRQHLPSFIRPAPAAIDTLLEREGAGTVTAKHAGRADRRLQGQAATILKQPDARREEPGSTIAHLRVEYGPPLQPWTDWAPAAERWAAAPDRSPGSSAGLTFESSGLASPGRRSDGSAERRKRHKT